MRLFTLFLLTTLAACSIDRDVARTAITPPPDAQIVEDVSDSCATFDFMFPEAAGLTVTENTVKHLDALHTAMHDQLEAEGNHSTLPPIMTYFGQFIDHDLTAEASADKTLSDIFGDAFGEGLYATAQIYADYQNKLVPMHFSWSSAARTGLYAYDQDSALFARDALTELLSDLASTGSGRLEIIAHSMGAFVLMEALRQMPKSDLARLRKRMGNITLLSPDLDIDVFTSQLKAAAPLPQPFYVLASRNDLILKLSTLLRGGSRRVGLGVEEFKKLRELGVIPIDVTSFSKGGSFNHQTFNDPDLISTVIALTRRNPGRSPSAAVIESFVADLR